MKIKFLLIMAVLMLCFSACGQNGDYDSDNTDKRQDIISESEIPSNHLNNSQDYIDQSKDMNNMKENDAVAVNVTESTSDEALAFARQLKAGWNLGNTFDAIDDTGYYEGAALDLEAKWCGVYTTRELIDEVKAQGFNTIRIPVSWHNHLTGRGFEINELWLDRVQNVIDYAYENDMYVILNIHHDVALAYYYPDSEHLDNSKVYMQTIWEQLSTRFRDYDNHLIFESVNEPRLVGQNIEWYVDINDSRFQDSMLAINELNQVFVNTVRNSGGNNVNRYLFIPSYDSSVDGAMADAFKLPEDIASHKLIVTVHAYLPYDLALNINGRPDFIKEDKTYIDQFMLGLNEKFIKKGIPVVIGEFGILNKNNLEDREAFTNYYVSKATENDMVCLWWDNNAFENGETFGLIDRKSLSVTYPGILEAIISNSL